MKLFAINLKSENGTLASELYQSLFGGETLVSSEPHAEWLSPWGIRFSFDRESANCPTQSGTFTVQMETRGLALDFWENCLKMGFKKEGNFPAIEVNKKHQYTSILDPWGNRVWIYFP